MFRRDFQIRVNIQGASIEEILDMEGEILEMLSDVEEYSLSYSNVTYKPWPGRIIWDQVGSHTANKKEDWNTAAELEATYGLYISAGSYEDATKTIELLKEELDNIVDSGEYKAICMYEIIW